MDYFTILNRLKKSLENYYSCRTYISLLAKDIGMNFRSLQRKLRGTTPFTLEEISNLADLLDVPMGAILEEESEYNMCHMELLLHDFSIEPKNYEYTLKKIIDIFHLAGKSKSSTLYIVCNMFPDIVFPEFEWLNSFNLMKWLYFNKKKVVPLSPLIKDEKALTAKKEYLDAIHHIKRSVYIVNINIVRNFLKYVHYFYMLNYLNKEDVKLLISDVHKLLKRVESLAIHGFVPENGKEIEIFYTDMALSDEMNLIESDNINLAIFYVQMNHCVINRNLEVVKIMKNWIYSWLRGAKLMSLGGTENLNYFLSRQEKEIQALEKELELT